MPVLRARHFSIARAPGTCKAADLIEHCLIGHGVHELQNGVAHDADAEDNDDDADAEAADVIEGDELLRIEEGERETGQSDYGRKHIHGVV
jgi:hypothetical protein